MSLSLPHCIILFMVEMLGFRLVGLFTLEGKCGCHSRLVLGRDKLGIRTLGSLISSHKDKSSRVLRNGKGTPLVFLENL